MGDGYDSTAQWRGIILLTHHNSDTMYTTHTARRNSCLNIAYTAGTAQDVRGKWGKETCA